MIFLRHLMIEISVVWFIVVVTQACRCGTLAQDPSPIPSTPELPSTNDRVSAIKMDILEKLGMDEAPAAPKPSPSNDTERKRIIEMYEASYRQLSSQTHDIAEEEHAKQFYSFPALQKHGKNVRRVGGGGGGVRGGFHVYFKTNIHQPKNTGSELQVTSATLRLFKDRVNLGNLRPGDRNAKHIRVNIYQLKRVGGKCFHGGAHDNSTARRTGTGSIEYNDRNTTFSPLREGDTSAPKRRKGRRFRRRLVQSHLVSLVTSGHWEEFDVSEAVKDWISNSSSNHGLLVMADSTDYRLRDLVRFRSKSRTISKRRGQSRLETGSGKSPVLNVFVQERQIPSRVRRSLNEPTDCRSEDGEKRCCRYSMWISFSEIGWSDWILAPAGYQAHFCAGSCPHRYKHANRFSIIKELVNARNPTAAPPLPCCSASRMSSLPIAHYNQDGVAVISVFEDMVVEECKCT